jgi:prenyltransferase beta subunit
VDAVQGCCSIIVMYNRRMAMRRLALSAVLLICPGVLHSQTREEIQASVQYLRALQTDSGGFTPRSVEAAGNEPNPPSLRATVGALRALKYFEREAKDVATCKKFVTACFDQESGGFADGPGGKPDVIVTAVGLMALVELNIPLDDYRDPAVAYLGKNAKSFEEIRMAAAGAEAAKKKPAEAEAWIKQITDMRNADGLYGKDDGQARDTGGAVAAILRLEGKVENSKEVTAGLKAGQRKDGAFGKSGTPASDLETSYRVMRAFMMLKEQPKDVPALREFISRCRNKDGGYGVAPGQPSSVSGTYYAAIIRHWLEKQK